MKRSKLSLSIEKKVIDGQTERLWNLAFDGNKYLVWTLRAIGICPIYRTADGSFKFKWVHLVTIYSIAIAVAGLVSSILFFGEILKNLTEENGELLLSYTPLMILPIIQVLLLITVIFEGRKIALCFNDWQDFQGRLDLTIHEKTPRKISKSWIVFTIVCTLGCINVGTKWSTFVENYYKEKSLDTFWHHLVTILHIHMMLVILGYLFFWAILTRSVRRAAEIIIDDIEALHWTSSGSLEPHTFLWLHLRQLCVGAGDTLCVAILCLWGVLYLSTLPNIYVGGVAAARGEYVTTASALIPLIYITIMAEFAHRAIEKTGRAFQARLTRLMMSGQAVGHELEIKGLLQTVAGCPPVISLAGYINIDRSINVPLYASSLTNFMMILNLTPAPEAAPEPSETTSPSNLTVSPILTTTPTTEDPGIQLSYRL